MFIILGGLLFFLIALVTLLRTNKRRAASTTIIISMLAGGIGALIGSFGENFLPLSTERLDEIKRTQSACVVDSLSQSTGTPTEMTLLKAIADCRSN